MKKIFSDLYQSEVIHPFAGVQAYAYYLLSPNAKVLLYNGGNEADFEAIKELGGLDYQFLSHRDEISPGLDNIKKRFNNKLCCHKNTQPLVEKVSSVEEVIHQRLKHSSQLEVIPTPGHTDGCLSFLYNSPAGETYLFSGDLISMTDNGWDTFIIPGRGADLKDVLASMKLYKQLSPDVLIPSASSYGSSSFFQFSKEDWGQSIDGYIKRLEGKLGG